MAFKSLLDTCAFKEGLYIYSVISWALLNHVIVMYMWLLKQCVLKILIKCYATVKIHFFKLTGGILRALKPHCGIARIWFIIIEIISRRWWPTSEVVEVNTAVVLVQWNALVSFSQILTFWTWLMRSPRGTYCKHSHSDILLNTSGKMQ